MHEHDKRALSNALLVVPVPGTGPYFANRNFLTLLKRGKYAIVKAYFLTVIFSLYSICSQPELL